MRKVSSRSSSRRRATFALAAISVAAVLGAGAALADGDGLQMATRGFGGISNVDHKTVPAGTWIFDVVAMDGIVRDLTLVVKSGPCPTGTIWDYKKIKKPTLDTSVTTDVIDAGDPTTSHDYCSQVAYPGGSAGSSITVSVTHPPHP